MIAKIGSEHNTPTNTDTDAEANVNVSVGVDASKMSDANSDVHTAGEQKHGSGDDSEGSGGLFTDSGDDIDDTIEYMNESAIYTLPVSPNHLFHSLALSLTQPISPRLQPSPSSPVDSRSDRLDDIRDVDKSDDVEITCSASVAVPTGKEVDMKDINTRDQDLLEALNNSGVQGTRACVQMHSCMREYVESVWLRICVWFPTFNSASINDHLPSHLYFIFIPALMSFSITGDAS